MTLDKSKHSVRLSVLNPQVRERVEKFDTGNDGELDINEAMQGLIALQKQSNNYKKMIWMLIPILSLMIAATFGTTILAINLTKLVAYICAYGILINENNFLRLSRKRIFL